MPPTVAAGKTFSVRQPSDRACSISDGVATPGKNGSSSSPQAATTASFVPGATANAAPASAASAACAGERTVPAPTSRPSI